MHTRQQYNDKIKEYNDKVEEINSKIKELTPTYVEDKWIQTTDNKFSVDVTQFSGKQAFAIWVKLVTSDEQTYYEEETYTISGTKKTEISVESISLDKTSLSLEEGSSYTLSAEITPSNATNKTVIWTSDNEKVAKVENGKITAISEGTALITAQTKDGEHTATCTVTVTKKAVTQNPSSTDDKTIAQGTMPDTGSVAVRIIILIVISLIIIGIICYKKIKYYNFK